MTRGGGLGDTLTCPALEGSGHPRGGGCFRAVGEGEKLGGVRAKGRMGARCCRGQQGMAARSAVWDVGGTAWERERGVSEPAPCLSHRKGRCRESCKKP